MTTLIIGASGATGRLLIEQLLARGETVKIVVRSLTSLPDAIIEHERVMATEASVLALSDAEMTGLVEGCQAVAFCLGHNLSLKGIFGQPRLLVTDATRRFCDAIRTSKPDSPVKFVLINTTGNRNRDLDGQISFAQKCVIFLLRLMLPPHLDNEEAADYLRCTIGPDDESIEWVAVRPDGLIDEPEVTDQDIYASPIHSAIFDAGKVSRINVANFMANLIVDEAEWCLWKGQMPVIYNKAQP
jgi:NAD(P)-dependent dehydrogenase (short-subunit alcohol dehydrogenase family)